MEDLPPLKCTNCEEAAAELRCVQCAQANEEHLFCYECSVIHAKQRETKGHAFEAMHICWNCEGTISTHRCMDCMDRAQHLCQNCSSIHCRVKRYKDHHVVKIDSEVNEEQRSRSCVNHVPSSSSSLTSLPVPLPSSFSSSSNETHKEDETAVTANDNHPSRPSNGTHNLHASYFTRPQLIIYHYL